MITLPAGIGRVDIVESRFVGMKSRGVYETPGGTILLTARRAVESICLDRGEAHMKVGGRAGGWALK
jgi:argininosuccinate synthase